MPASHTKLKPATKNSANRPMKTFFAFWGGSLGFVIGATIAAFIGKWLGWWPPSEAYLRKQARKDV
ncbi:MAG TPA: hypothetical protein VH186_19885 [Chloroflexia bacterium]|nr:hypothetical protein [Chloroflexia bacterium]